MDVATGLLALLLLLVGCFVFVVDNDRRDLLDKNERLADALDDAASDLARSQVDPLTGSTFTSRRPPRRGWRPEPRKRVDALRALASTGGEEPDE